MTRVRVRARTRWFWSPATASSAGIGHFFAVTPRSESTSTFAPLAIAVSALANMAANRRLHAVGAVGHREHHVEHGHVERLVVARRRQQAAGAVVALQRLEARHLRVVEERALAEDHPAALGLRIEQVALGADRGPDRGHELLADRVERRIGDLREQLLEVVGQRPRRGGSARRCAASLPIEPSGSSPLSAIGAIRTFRSSCV